MQIEATISPDRSTLSVKIGGVAFETGAIMLESIMRDLAVFRASMLPGQKDGELMEGDCYSCVPAIRWFIGLDPDAPTQIRMYVLHLGFGWIWLPLGEANVVNLQREMERILALRPKLC